MNFIVSAVGIFFRCFYCGFLHEKISRGRYGEILNQDGTEGERFTFTLSLVATQLIFNWFFAKGILKFYKEEDDTNWKSYACGATTYLMSSLCANLALKWINYPTQVIAKSAKPIPVMLMSVILGGRSYSREKYVFVSMIVSGVILFMYKNGELDRNRENEEIGKTLVIFSLILDGLSAAIQERMRDKSAPTGPHMMLNLNKWSSIMLSFVLLVTGEPLKFIPFVIRHPQVLIDLASLALGGALGQLFIFNMISNFGSLANSLVTTTRKFFTVLFSVLIFGNSLTSSQWIGTVLVFLGLFADIIFEKLLVHKYKFKFEKLQ